MIINDINFSRVEKAVLETIFRPDSPHDKLLHSSQNIRSYHIRRQQTPQACITIVVSISQISKIILEIFHFTINKMQTHWNCEYHPLVTSWYKLLEDHFLESIASTTIAVMILGDENFRDSSTYSRVGKLRLTIH